MKRLYLRILSSAVYSTTSTTSSTTLINSNMFSTVLVQKMSVYFSVPILVINCQLNIVIFFKLVLLDVMPVPNRNHKPSANGCGSIGMKINTEYLPAMTKCCDAHDICYDMCGSGKMECDRKFQQCLNNQCDGVSKNLGAQPGIGNFHT